MFLRFIVFARWAIVYDGAVYSVMGWSFAQHGEFLVPYTSGVAYYHHYGPLWPMVLGGFYDMFGYSIGTTRLGELVLAVALIAAALFTTADLFSPRKAWYVAAYVALEPMFLITGALGYAEVLVGLLFLLTMWAIVKSLGKPQYMILAGVLAGLGFLAKSSVGYVFVLAGIAGLAWRWRYHGRAGFRQGSYVIGVAAFGAIAGAWCLRNLMRYGWPHWETSAYLEHVYSYGTSHPELLGEALLLKLPLFAMFFLFYGGLFLPELRYAWYRRKDEATSALWLSIVLVFTMGWIVSSFFWTVEQTPMWWHDPIRYVVIVSPVMLWLALGETSRQVGKGWVGHSRLKSFRRRFLGLMAGFVIVAVVLAAFPAPYADVAILRELDGRVVAGDRVAVDGLSIDVVIPYLAGSGAEIVAYRSGFNGTFIVSARDVPYVGFALVASSGGHDLTGYSYACHLWERSVSDLA